MSSSLSQNSYKQFIDVKQIAHLTDWNVSAAQKNPAPIDDLTHQFTDLILISSEKKNDLAFVKNDPPNIKIEPYAPKPEANTQRLSPQEINRLGFENDMKELLREDDYDDCQDIFSSSEKII